MTTLAPCRGWTKRRQMFNHHMDSTVWDDLRFRPDDVVIASYAKSGTTWVQQIVGQLIYGGDPTLDVAALSPWVDLRIPDKQIKLSKLEAQQQRRFLKTHLPVDALVYSPLVKYIYVARDARDVVWSLYDHHVNANDMWYREINDTAGRVGPPITPPVDDVKQYWYEWLARDGYPFWPFWHNVGSWWEVRGAPNVLLVHYADLKSNLMTGIHRIADFLGFSNSNRRAGEAARYCTFEWMKSHAQLCAPLNGELWNGGGKTFINKGRNGRWGGVLSDRECYEYERLAIERLGERCANWLKHGCHK